MYFSSSEYTAQLLASPLISFQITNSAAHSSLACLAARVVRKHDLELDSLPVTLQAFVLHH